MNYFELVNKCLLELNFKEVNSFSELVKNDHKKILNILNIINKEICALENWNFLLRHKRINLETDTNKINLTDENKILHLVIDKQEYIYQEDIRPFLSGIPVHNKYTVFNGNILIPKITTEKYAEIYYYTANCAADETHKERTDMTTATDYSLIPMPFAEQLLVYGTCLRLKANPSYVRFSYWMSMYKEALLNLKSKSSGYAKDKPKIRLYRH